jgi:hypothetical protein
MKKIIKKIKNKKAFVILFAVTLSSIMLAIGLGVADIALKEIKFNTSAKDTNDAFFAADTAIECALMNDKPPSTSFAVSGGSGQVQCLGGIINLTGSFPVWKFIIPHLGNPNNCAIVTVSKDNTSKPPFILTSMVSKGYNIGDASCNSTNPNRIERELDINY